MKNLERHKLTGILWLSATMCYWVNPLARWKIDVLELVEVKHYFSTYSDFTSIFRVKKKPIRVVSQKLLTSWSVLPD